MTRAAIVMSLLLLAACGRPQQTPAEIARSAPRAPTPSGPVYSTVGTVISAELNRVTIDHEAVPGGVAAGRTIYRAYADTLAEAPLTPGSRVSFSYQMAGSGPILTELRPR